MDYPENLNANIARRKTLEANGKSIGDIYDRALAAIWDAASEGDTECCLDAMLGDRHAGFESKILSEFLGRKGFEVSMVGEVIVISW